MIRRLLIRGLVCTFPLWAAAGMAETAVAAPEKPAASPQLVVARGGAHEAFGRVVFDWPQPVGHSAHISGNRLEIRFDRPMQTALGSIRRNLSAYIARIALAPDGRTITATLKGAYTLRSFVRGNRVVIDLLKPGGQTGPAPESNDAQRTATATPPGGNAEAAMRAGSRPTPLRRRAQASVSGDAGAAPEKAELVVRGGSHEGYGRLVFEWASRVGYRLDRKGRIVSVRFDRTAELDTAVLQRNLPPQFNSAQVNSTAKGLRISLVVARGARLRHFRDGNVIVLDAIGGAAAADNAAKEPPVAKPPPQSAASSPAKQRPPAASLPVRKAGGGPVPLAQRARELARKRRMDRFKKQVSIPGALVTVDATRRGDEVSIRFNWRKQVAAAVYRRGNVMWVVFDRLYRINLSSVLLVGKKLFTAAEQLSVPDYSVLRLAMSQPYEIAVKRAGTVWIIDIGPKPKPPGRTVRIKTRYSGAAGARIVLTAKGAERAIRLHDPDVGDVVYVVPFITPSLGNASTRNFLDFNLLSSAQGLVIVPAAETLSVGVGKDQVTISRPGGLRISRKVDLAKRKAGKKKELLNFAAWRGGPSENFQDYEHKLFQRITSTRGASRNAARLGLVRFYVSYGLGAEALGVLQAVKRESPSVMRDYNVRALRGLANYQLGHFAEALSDLDHPSLKREPEIHPWLAGIAAARGDWASAYRMFENADEVIQSYPPDMAAPFTILAAEAALSMEDIDSAASRLSVLEKASVTEAQLDHISYLRGHLAKQTGDLEKGLSIWEAVARIGDRPSRAKAAFARINTMLEEELIKPDEAVEKLEALRFAWRNDVFEFDLLHRLGLLYASKKDYRNALLTLRRAATYYSTIKAAQALTGEMSRIFKEYYSQGDADKQPPISALGIYQEFRELTPSGEEGDELVARLADRLINVDLLSQAGDLLEHQIAQRLKGAAKVETGIRVAKIRLMDNNPRKSLEALEKSTIPDIPAPLEVRRKHVEAMALSRLDRPDDALKVIADDTSDTADLLRADILWNAKRWRRASRILARLTGGLSRKNIDGRAAQLLLRRAVALALSKDEVGVSFLRERFGKAMQKTAYSHAFLAVVGKKKIDTDDYRIFARKASGLDEFLAFRRSDLARSK